MVVLKNTTNIAMNEYNEIRFFKGFFLGIITCTPFLEYYDSLIHLAL